MLILRIWKERKRERERERVHEVDLHRIHYQTGQVFSAVMMPIAQW